MLILDSIFGNEADRYAKKTKKIVINVRKHIDELNKISSEELKQKTKYFKDLLKSGKTLEDIKEEVFACVCIASKRTTGMDPFDVQIIGANALHDKSIVEMRTGEGKTLVAVFPSYLNALTGKLVHIVTVNDYLARRDAVWMGQIFDALGMSVGVINGQNKSYLYDPEHNEKDKERDEIGAYKIVYDFLREMPRKDSYKADVLYGTNNEFVFDYLRDNIEYDKNNIRHRDFYFAIVDEVDSILIDEARSPLIISSAVNVPSSHYTQFFKFSNTLKIDEDYTVDEKLKSISLTPSGIEKFEKTLKVENVYVEGGQRVIHYLQNALRAKSLYKKDKNYIVQDNKIVIIDEFTGRLQHGRQWSEGLHQAIEAKEGVQIQQETRTYASITYQNYFKMYEKLCGMTGTAESSEEEFYKVYHVPVVKIPTNKNSKRVDHADVIYQTHNAKFNAVIKKIIELNKKGQPILVGTASIEHNEELSKKLKKLNIKHEVLNAKNHEREGEIIAQAGGYKTITIATNLAGRGVDIKLGDTKGENSEEIKKSGGLFVLGTERHESRRIDDQLRGRCGRQGDEGETQFFLSLEDDLTRIFGSEHIKNLASRLGLPEDQAIQNKIISKSIESAQKRIEGHNFDARRFSLEYDTILNKHRTEVYKKRHSVLFSEDEKIFYDFFDSELIDSIKEDGYIKKMIFSVLKGIDITWMEHLELMDYARSSANLRSYGQKEPIMEYKKEGNNLFVSFWDNVRNVANEEIKH